MKSTPCSNNYNNPIFICTDKTTIASDMGLLSNFVTSHLINSTLIWCVGFLLLVSDPLPVDGDLGHLSS